jgi:carbon monoxide dehydrogenase subunit G
MGVTVAVLIAAPLDRVWEAAADLEAHGQWMADVEAIRFSGESRRGAGTRVEVATRVGPLTTLDAMEVTAWEPPRRIAVRHLGLVSGEGEFRLDPVGGGVMFSWSEDIRFPWRLGGPLGALAARPVLAGIWRRNLRRLKRRLEAAP